MSAEGLRRRGYRERPVRRGPGCRRLSRRGGTRRPAGGFPRENRRTQRRAGHHLWTTMGEAQPPAAAAPPWARSRVAEVARELGALRDILRTARGLVPFPLSHPTGAGDAGPELRLGLFPCRRSRPCARSLPGPGSGCDTQTLLVFLALVYAQGLGLACEFQRTRVLQIKSIAVQDCRAHSVSGRRTT